MEKGFSNPLRRNGEMAWVCVEEVYRRGAKVAKGRGGRLGLRRIGKSVRWVCVKGFQYPVGHTDPFSIFLIQLWQDCFRDFRGLVSPELGEFLRQCGIIHSEHGDSEEAGVGGAGFADGEGGGGDAGGHLDDGE